MYLHLNAQGTPDTITGAFGDEVEKYDAINAGDLTAGLLAGLQPVLDKANQFQTIVIDVVASDAPVQGTFSYVVSVSIL